MAKITYTDISDVQKACIKQTVVREAAWLRDVLCREKDVVLSEKDVVLSEEIIRRRLRERFPTWEIAIRQND